MASDIIECWKASA